MCIRDRGRSDTAAVELTPFDLAALLRTVALELLPQARAKQIDFGIHTPAAGIEAVGDSGLPVSYTHLILIGAYTESLRLMCLVGVDPTTALLRLPLTLQFPDGQGLQLPDLAPPLDALLGIVRAKGWGWQDKVALLRTATAWQLRGFRCAPHTSVADLCAPLTPRLMAEFIDPLCVSALNTPCLLYTSRCV